VAANGSSQAAITVTVHDAAGNPVAGQAVSLAASGTMNNLSANQGTTNASGVLTATLASSTAETKTITATIGSIMLTAQVTFVAGGAGPGSTLMIAPNNVVADGVAAETATVQLYDANNNVLAGTAVSLRASGNGTIINNATGTTDANGRFSTTVT